ncbi:putative pentatricopeptide repeat-containing protein At1g77010, mitochondrial isoform X1 [Amaranthus tricolor]|uniref:putative pentatricopeptide repeat-containing protein At1g77010, mitochondrial isoform X1 n=1 Tax=Amaranthus tricolor TaxID=29722 RepID=UPI0025867D39|nr:putative pentatricopeptide repeat-containing protein At1g77010, mitochondrial isoform X1 [Amaranthus tricolor]
MDFNLRYYAQLFQHCNTKNSINQVKQIHLFLLKKGILNSVITIGNRLLQVYAKCSNMKDAAKVFEEMPQRNCFSWNTLLEGFIKSGNVDKASELFNSMPYKNEFSWNVVISGCAKSGDLHLARMLFNQMPEKNGIAWNSMIHGYARHGYPTEALNLFKDMSLGKRDPFVLATIFGACTDMMAIDCGKQIHARIIIDGVEYDKVLSSSLVNLYSKCGDLVNAENVFKLTKEIDDFSLSALITGYANLGKMDDARRLFHHIGNPCVVVWNSLISGCVTNDQPMEGLILFNIMRYKGLTPDCSTFASILSACSSIAILEYGKQLHNHALKVGVSKDVIVGCSLIDMYSKCGNPYDSCELFNELELHDTVLLNSMINVYCNCGRMQEAKQIFDNIHYKTLISWNSMLAGFSQNGCPHSAIHLFCEMNKLEVRIDKFSLASVISCCASITALNFGEQIFARATVIGLETDLIVSTSLIDFYCKCGFISMGRKLFDRMVKSDVVCWNSMLTGYATNGKGIEVLDLFASMRHAGVQPNDVTFTVVLSASSHCGLIEEARKWFYLMKSDYNIEPGYEHYACMVDLLARFGCLEEAAALLKQMPVKADVTMWSSVLRGCVVHGNKNLGKEVSEIMIHLDPENSSAYVHLSGIFASSGDWEGSVLIRDMMKTKRAEKIPGISW